MGKNYIFFLFFSFSVIRLVRPYLNENPHVSKALVCILRRKITSINWFEIQEMYFCQKLCEWISQFSKGYKHSSFIQTFNYFYIIKCNLKNQTESDCILHLCFWKSEELWDIRLFNIEGLEPELCMFGHKQVWL